MEHLYKELDARYDNDERSQREDERSEADAQWRRFQDYHEAAEKELSLLSLTEQIALFDHLAWRIEDRRKFIETITQKRNDAPHDNPVRTEYQRMLDEAQEVNPAIKYHQRMLDQASEGSTASAYHQQELNHAPTLNPEVDYYRRMLDEAPETNPVRVYYQRVLDDAYEELNLAVIRYRVLDELLSVRSRQKLEKQGFRGELIARRCRPYIEAAINLDHAYAIGHASMQEVYDESVVKEARGKERRAKAKYVKGDWERAGFLDPALDAKPRLEELKRRIIRFVDEQIFPR